MKDPFEPLEKGIYPQLALSLYLPAPPDLGYSPTNPGRVFAQLARDLRAGASDPEVSRALRRERPRVEGYLRSRQAAPGLALAVFAYQPYELLAGWALPRDEPPLLRLDTALHLEPIRRQLAQQPPALVVAADKEQARIFRVLLGEVDELVSLSGRPVKHHHQGGWSALGHQRREEQHARVNLAAAARWLAAQDYAFYRRVHLAGPEEARTQLRALLPRPVRERLAPELSLSLYLPPGQMAARLREEVRLLPQPAA